MCSISMNLVALGGTLLLPWGAQTVLAIITCPEDGHIALGGTMTFTAARNPILLLTHLHFITCT